MEQTRSHAERHLEEQVVSLYAEGELPTEERATVEAHLAACDACRREVTEVKLFLGRERARSTRWLVPSLTATAAAVLLLFLLWPGATGDAGERLLREAGAGDRLPAVTAVSPGGETPVLPDSVVFRWRSAGPGAFYRLTVATAEGGIVWRTETGDTAATPPPGRLAAGQSYHWFVDALLPDGREATTGVLRFRVVP